MPHANAPLTELGRLRLARCVVDDGWPLRRAAERFQVSVTTAARWSARYRLHGPAGMVDRSSRPLRPARTSRRMQKRIVRLRTQRGWGPARIGPKVGMAPSTVGKVLRRAGMPRLADVDLATRQQLRRSVARYEHPSPGDWSTSTSRSWAGSPTAAAGRSGAGGSGPTSTAAADTRSSTPRSMITHGWPTARSWPTNRAAPLPRSGSGPMPGSPSAGSRSEPC